MINNVVLMGRLTYEPELKVTPSGVSFIRFQIACDRAYQKAGEERKADFIDCIAWRSTAEFISRYFHKGSMLALQGALQTDSYQDKDGNNRKKIEVNVSQVSFCGSAAKNESTVSAPPSEPTQPARPIVQEQYDNVDLVEDDDELPF